MSITAKTIAEVIRIRARENGENILYAFESEEMSFATLDRNSNKAANAMASQGVGKGHRISYLGKNSHIYFELLCAAIKLGAVMAPVNWRLAPPEVAYVINDCQAQMLFIGPEFEELIGSILPSLDTVNQVYGALGAVGDYPDYNAWRDSFGDDDPMTEVSATDAALQLYTSGTTGHPKGAVLTHKSLLASHYIPESEQQDWQKKQPGEILVLAMPCFHIAGSISGLNALVSAGKCIIMSEYDPSAALELIEHNPIGKLFMVPAAIQIMLNHPRVAEVDFSQLEYITYGASPIPLDLMKQSIDRFGCGFVQMYGMTETSGTIVALPPEDHDPEGNERMRSVGKPLQGVEIKIIDGDGKKLPVRSIGEIATRSVQNMKCYWNLRDATAETIDNEGWLRTGDAGYLDEDGYLYIQDRIKDMIISGGENVYPAEVENALYGHPKVADVAVIAVPHEKWGEAVKACVVVKEGESMTAEELIAFGRTQIAGYKCPKSVDFIAELPRNPSGKILRRELRAPYWEGADRAVN